MTQEVSITFEAPQPELTAKSVREGVMIGFMDQLDGQVEAKTPLMDMLVQTGHVTIGPDNKVQDVSEYLKNIMFTSVDEVTGKMGFCMMRNAYLPTIGPDGVMPPVQIQDTLRATQPDGSVKHVTMVAVLHTRPATEEEAAMADKRNVVVS